MKIGAICVVVWLAMASSQPLQREYLSNAKTSCAEVGDTAVTIGRRPAQLGRRQLGEEHARKVSQLHALLLELIPGRA